jgi:hypothetical protein
MTTKDIPHIRLVSQQIAATSFKTPKEVVRYMGMMQAQDYAMAKWGVGARLSKATDKQIETALDNAHIIRTHVLRPTWHFVSPEDIYWMLELSAPQINALMKSRNKELELTEAIYTKSNKVIAKALSAGKHLTRDELTGALVKAKIGVNDNRASHLLIRAELDQIICSGTLKNKKPTYALLEERVAKPKAIKRDEALAKLAERYFTSHCPATIADFTWWSGLPAKDAKNALQMVKDKLICETIGGENYWLSDSFSGIKKEKSSSYLLPAFDEYIISYKDRSAAVEFKSQTKTFTKNGIFNPVIVINGQVTGIWKRTVVKDKVQVAASLFKKHSKASKTLVEKAAKAYGKFIDKQAVVNYNDEVMDV